MDGRIEAEFVTAGQRHNHKHDYIVDKAFLYWGDSDSVLLQATIMRSGAPTSQRGAWHSSRPRGMRHCSKWARSTEKPRGPCS